MADDKQDPALYRVVETMRGPDGRLVKSGQVWQPDLARTRKFGRVLAANSVAQKVQVADEAGVILETIPQPPPGMPPPGWGDWRTQAAAQPPLPSLPPRPPRPAPARKGLPGMLAAAKPPALPAPPPPTPASPFDEVERTATLTPATPLPLPPESAVERTATLPPG